jgi:hypothetical protein
MTRRTVEELIQQANASLPDNNVAAIDPADVRNTFLDTLDTFTPMYGGMAIASKSVNVSTTPATLPFDTEISSIPPEWVVTPANGTLSRTLGAVGAITSKLFVGGIAEGAQGNILSIGLYKNGAQIRKTQETMEGPAKPVGFGLQHIDGNTTNVEYKLVLSMPSGSGTFTLTDVSFIGENIPVRTVPAVGKLA